MKRLLVRHWNKHSYKMFSDAATPWFSYLPVWSPSVITFSAEILSIVAACWLEVCCAPLPVPPMVWLPCEHSLLAQTCPAHCSQPPLRGAGVDAYQTFNWCTVTSNTVWNHVNPYKPLIIKVKISGSDIHVIFGNIWPSLHLIVLFWPWLISNQQPSWTKDL